MYALLAMRKLRPMTSIFQAPLLPRAPLSARRAPAQRSTAPRLPARSLPALLLVALLFAGCTALGPASIQRDRFDYNAAVSDSWKDQTLLNIVKLRYADMPLFMEVASIVSGYSLESSVNLSGSVFEGGRLPTTGTLGGQSKYIDRPTITYQPITGEHFNETFLQPIPPSSVLFLIQAGWPADIVLPITLEAINGLRAPREAGARMREGDAGYDRVVALLAAIQRAGALGMRVEQTGDGLGSTVLLIRRWQVPAEVDEARAELAELLRLEAGHQQYTVAYGEIPERDNELAMLTRSILSIMVELAGEVRVPPAHLEQGRVTASLTDLHPDAPHRLIDIHSSADRPDDAFVAVRYQDHWFSIANSDFASKRTFAYLMLLFSLTESGDDEGLPLVTIPAG